MNDTSRSPKIRPWHLDRDAVVYVRQSTPQQVVDHQESTARQYALADRAVELGWTRGHVSYGIRESTSRFQIADFRSQMLADSRFTIWNRGSEMGLSHSGGLETVYELDSLRHATATSQASEFPLDSAFRIDLTVP